MGYIRKAAETNWFVRSVWNTGVMVSFGSKDLLVKRRETFKEIIWILSNQEIIERLLKVSRESAEKTKHKTSQNFWILAAIENILAEYDLESRFFTTKNHDIHAKIENAYISVSEKIFESDPRFEWAPWGNTFVRIPEYDDEHEVPEWLINYSVGESLSVAKECVDWDGI